MAAVEEPQQLRPVEQEPPDGGGMAPCSCGIGAPHREQQRQAAAAPSAAAAVTAPDGQQASDACTAAAELAPCPVGVGDFLSASFRVLLVDDDPVTLRAVEQLLRKFGYQVTTATNGRDAMELLKRPPSSAPFDLLLTDILMPQVSGFDLIHEVMHGTLFSDVPVVVMSSQDSQESVLKAFEAGAADYLIKPIRRNEVATLWQHVWRANRFKAAIAVAGGPAALGGSGAAGSMQPHPALGSLPVATNCVHAAAGAPAAAAAVALTEQHATAPGAPHAGTTGEVAPTAPSMLVPVPAAGALLSAKGCAQQQQQPEHTTKNGSSGASTTTGAVPPGLDQDQASTMVHQQRSHNHHHQQHHHSTHPAGAGGASLHSFLAAPSRLAVQHQQGSSAKQQEREHQQHQPATMAADATAGDTHVNQHRNPQQAATHLAATGNPLPPGHAAMPSSTTNGNCSGTNMAWRSSYTAHGQDGLVPSSSAAAAHSNAPGAGVEPHRLGKRAHPLDTHDSHREQPHQHRQLGGGGEAPGLAAAVTGRGGAGGSSAGGACGPQRADGGASASDATTAAATTTTTSVSDDADGRATSPLTAPLSADARAADHAAAHAQPLRAVKHEPPPHNHHLSHCQGHVYLPVAQAGPALGDCEAAAAAGPALLPASCAPCDGAGATMEVDVTTAAAPPQCTRQQQELEDAEAAEAAGLLLGVAAAAAAEHQAAHRHHHHHHHHAAAASSHQNGHHVAGGAVRPQRSHVGRSSSGQLHHSGAKSAFSALTVILPRGLAARHGEQQHHSNGSAGAGSRSPGAAALPVPQHGHNTRHAAAAAAAAAVGSRGGSAELPAPSKPQHAQQQQQPHAGGKQQVASHGGKVVSPGAPGAAVTSPLAGHVAGQADLAPHASGGGEGQEAASSARSVPGPSGVTTIGGSSTAWLAGFSTVPPSFLGPGLDSAAGMLGGPVGVGASLLMDASGSPAGPLQDPMGSRPGGPVYMGPAGIGPLMLPHALMPLLAYSLAGITPDMLAAMHANPMMAPHMPGAPAPEGAMAAGLLGAPSSAAAANPGAAASVALYGQMEAAAVAAGYMAAAAALQQQQQQHAAAVAAQQQQQQQQQLQHSLSAGPPQGQAGPQPPFMPPGPFSSVVVVAGRDAVNVAAHRRAAVQKYLQKKKTRNFKKKVRYESRKRLAEARPRVRGQFVKQDPTTSVAAAAVTSGLGVQVVAAATNGGSGTAQTDMQGVVVDGGAAGGAGPGEGLEVTRADGSKPSMGSMQTVAGGNVSKSGQQVGRGRSGSSSSGASHQLHRGSKRLRTGSGDALHGRGEEEGGEEEEGEEEDEEDEEEEDEGDQEDAA